MLAEKEERENTRNPKAKTTIAPKAKERSLVGQINFGDGKHCLSCGLELNYHCKKDEYSCSGCGSRYVKLSFDKVSGEANFYAYLSRGNKNSRDSTLSGREDRDRKLERRLELMDVWKKGMEGQMEAANCFTCRRTLDRSFAFIMYRSTGLVCACCHYCVDDIKATRKVSARGTTLPSKSSVRFIGKLARHAPTLNINAFSEFLEEEDLF